MTTSTQAQAINNAFHGATLIKRIGNILLIKRDYAPHGKDKNFLISHHMIDESGKHSFYWSTYDLTLEEATQLLNEKGA